jgi:hypothetical protein
MKRITRRHLKIIRRIKLSAVLLAKIAGTNTDGWAKKSNGMIVAKRGNR